MLMLENGIEAKNWITDNIYPSKRCATYPKGIDKNEETSPSPPAKKLNSIVIGIKGKIKILAGRETSEKIPVE